MLIEAAQAGNEREVEECAKLFIDHAAKLEEVSLVCSCQKVKNPVLDYCYYYFFLHYKNEDDAFTNRVMISNDSAPFKCGNFEPA